MIQLLDTHQHLIYPDIAGVSWTDGIPALADQSFSIDDYLNLTGDKDVVGSLFMEAGVDDGDYQTEIYHIADLAKDPANRILGIIASCRPETDEGYDPWLEQCSALPVVGFRRILHEIDDDLSRSETFRRNIRKLGDRNFTFDMCFLARQLPIAFELATACDNTNFVLDHCGVPDVAGGAFDSWKEDLADVAALPHVSCKISGIMAYCATGTASLETIRPWLDHVVACFGPDRLVWGSDWPVVNLANGIGDWIEVTQNYLGTFSTGEAEKIAHLNARKIYHLSDGV